MRARDGQNTGVRRELRQRQRDGCKSKSGGGSSLVFCAGGGLDAVLAPDDGAASWDEVSRGGADVCCCWCCADALAVVSGWVASFSLVLSGALASSWRAWLWLVE